jgi:hypothetical protein
MVKLVDTRDLKSRARKGVPVRFRLRAPFIQSATQALAGSVMRALPDIAMPIQGSQFIMRLSRPEIRRWKKLALPYG